MMQPSPTIPTILLATATGARTMAGLAATARSAAAIEPTIPSPQPARFLAAPGVAVGAAALAVMELVADKLPGIPNRTDPMPLVGRVIAGGVIGAAIAAVAERDRLRGAVVGAVAALLGAHLSFQLRRELAERLPSTLAAVVEDTAVGALAAAGFSALARSRVDQPQRHPQRAGRD
jgi:uncharacterized membrane protein